MRIVFENVTARVAAQEELIGHGTGAYQRVQPGQVIVETATPGVLFSLPFQAFKELHPEAVYDPETRRFRDPDPVLDED
jgi:hypothetical protein